VLVPEISWLELLFLLLVLAGGFAFLHDANVWARNAIIGDVQYGDAEFWWNGAIHFSQGIVAQNPNLTYRMGYAVFGGLVAAVLGPEYRDFHAVLLSIFLLLAGGLYFSLRHVAGRIAAVAAVVLLVFNPYTAEWLAVSTSDALGMILNVSALLALTVGVRDGLRFRWIALFGVLFSLGSLTRPLMTLFLAPALLVVIHAAWRQWGRILRGIWVMLVAFAVPTLMWMSLMAAIAGNFALTGEGQDASTLYAASDPQIQIWRPDMYDKVSKSACRRYHVPDPSPSQINAEFWALTRENYLQHWRFHLSRVWPHVQQLARFTPAQASYANQETKPVRQLVKAVTVFALLAVSFARRRWGSALLLGGLGYLWVGQSSLQPHLVVAASLVAVMLLAWRQRSVFLWAAYWWVGVFALFLVGGTWGPPLGAAFDLNALGYRLGFQFLFVEDVLIPLLLGVLALGSAAPGFSTHTSTYWWLCPAPRARQLSGNLLVLAALGLTLLLGAGSSIVCTRLVKRALAHRVPYPELRTAEGSDLVREAEPIGSDPELRVRLAAHDGSRLLMKAMSSSFIWNLPGQERAMLLLYRQDYLDPVDMHPSRFDVEVSRHLPRSQWMNRRGAWVMRSFPNMAQVSNLPYYFEMPAIQAFVPVSADGRFYDVDKAVIFPLAKTATQLVASRELAFFGTAPKWALDSGPLKYARRFALLAGSTGWKLDLAQARGNRVLSFYVQHEAAAGASPLHVRLATSAGKVLWRSDLPPGGAPVAVKPALPAGTTGLRFLSPDLPVGSTLWFYELVLVSDDFVQ